MKILLVDDDPAIRLLASEVLKQGGFAVECAADGREALRVARRKVFDLVLLDQLMPDMPGSDVLEKLRKHPRTRDRAVAFFTAKTSPDDVQSLRALGVAGLIKKPFDPTTLSSEVLSILRDCGKLPPSGPVAVDHLVDDFLTQTRQECDDLLVTLESPSTFDLDQARQIVHRWIGRGGTFGYANVSQIAQRAESLLARFPQSIEPLRTEVRSLQQSLREGSSSPQPTPSVAEAEPQVLAPDGPVARAAREKLGGKRVALVGFETGEQEQVATTMDAVGAFTRALPVSAVSEPQQLQHYDLIVVRLGLDSGDGDGWAALDQPKPVLLVGPPGSIETDLPTAAQVDFSLWPVRWEELLMRAHRLMSGKPSGSRAGSDDNRSIVVADDDTTVTALVDQTLTSYEFECQTAETGTEALELVEQLQPAAVILDVNMPGMSGFQVLSRLKSSKRTRAIPVVIVTALKREADILRGFSLGADDYVTKPFNPIELVARLKRILTTSQRVGAA